MLMSGTRGGGGGVGGWGAGLGLGLGRAWRFGLGGGTHGGSNRGCRRCVAGGAWRAGAVAGGCPTAPPLLSLTASRVGVAVGLWCGLQGVGWLTHAEVWGLCVHAPPLFDYYLLRRYFSPVWPLVCWAWRTAACHHAPSPRFCCVGGRRREMGQAGQLRGAGQGRERGRGRLVPYGPGQRRATRGA